MSSFQVNYNNVAAFTNSMQEVKVDAKKRTLEFPNVNHSLSFKKAVSHFHKISTDELKNTPENPELVRKIAHIKFTFSDLYEGLPKQNIIVRIVLSIKHIFGISSQQKIAKLDKQIKTHARVDTDQIDLSNATSHPLYNEIRYMRDHVFAETNSRHDKVIDLFYEGKSFESRLRDDDRSFAKDLVKAYKSYPAETIAVLADMHKKNGEKFSRLTVIAAHHYCEEESENKGSANLLLLLEVIMNEDTKFFKHLTHSPNLQEIT